MGLIKNLFIFLFVFLLLGFSVNALGDDLALKGYKCLKDNIDEKGCSALNIDESIFAFMGTEKCKDKLLSFQKTEGCFGSASCNTKRTAQSIVALEVWGESTNEAVSWLSGKKAVFQNLIWFLQLDVDDTGTCTIKASNSSYSVEISKYKKLTSTDTHTCFSITSDGYWIKVNNPLCYEEDFEISCDSAFSSTVLFKTTNDPIIHVLKPTEFASANGKITEKISSYCFEEGSSCNYESTLWAAFALELAGKETYSYLPYLIVFSGENQQLLPESFLYFLTGKEAFATILKQKQQSDGSWISGNKLYGTAIALFPFQGYPFEEKTKAIEWVDLIQNNKGCFPDRNLEDVAFLLYSIWPEYADYILDDCYTDEDCKEDETCQQGECVSGPECILDEECSEDKECISNFCMPKPECRIPDIPCPENEECIDEICYPLPECILDEECPEEECKSALCDYNGICIYDYISCYDDDGCCTPECDNTNDNDCPEGPACLDDSDCDNYKDESSPYCIGNNSVYKYIYTYTCSSNNTCIETETNTFVENCSVNEECSYGKCISLPECTLNSQCGEEGVCVSGECLSVGPTPDCADEGYFCMTRSSCNNVQGNILNEYDCSGINICCDKQKETCTGIGGEICYSNEICNGEVNNDLSSPSYDETCCIGTCEISEPTPEGTANCEQNNGVCRYECNSDEEESLFYTCDYNESCCVSKSKGKSRVLIWILIILIILAVIGIIFRNKLRPFWFKLKSKFSKGKKPPAKPGQRPFGKRPMPSGRMPVRGNPRLNSSLQTQPNQKRRSLFSRRKKSLVSEKPFNMNNKKHSVNPPARKPMPLKKPQTQTKSKDEGEDIFKKLRDMGK